MLADQASEPSANEALRHLVAERQVGNQFLRLRVRVFELLSPPHSGRQATSERDNDPFVSSSRTVTSSCGSAKPWFAMNPISATWPRIAFASIVQRIRKLRDPGASDPLAALHFWSARTALPQAVYCGRAFVAHVPRGRRRTRFHPDDAPRLTPKNAVISDQ